MAELLDAQPAPIGHNRPALPAYAPMPAGAVCSRCHHWKAPDPHDGSAYDYWRATGRSACYNYEPDRRPRPEQDRRGFLTIYQGDGIVWQGTEGDEPAEFRQGELFA
ncbi:hypothetical protein [Roseomonas gilardii]|uniref:hypothetical protein n=1 Tax=Roseomonas gilardii TaxID=257708 RepID=UPI0012EC758A|nr:hypothetical protein [Roseomonas gilardii]